MIKKKILVTGGTGYIGSHTVVELQNAGYEVVIVDNLSNSNADVIEGITKISGIRPKFEKVDCNDLSALTALFKKHRHIDGIIHFAASKAVGESVQKPLFVLELVAECLLMLRVAMLSLQQVQLEWKEQVESMLRLNFLRLLILRLQMLLFKRQKILIIHIIRALFNVKIRFTGNILLKLNL